MDSTIIGLACSLFSGLFFGSVFTPIKKYDLRDGTDAVQHYMMQGDVDENLSGFFVQWVQSAAIFHCGLAVNFIRSQPRFEPLAALGGYLFVTGNIVQVPLLNNFGVGLTILISGSVQILSGWAAARFGLFGLTEQVPSNPAINYIGVAMTLLSGLMFTFVKSDATSLSNDEKVPAGFTQEDPLPLKAINKVHVASSRIFQSKVFYLILAVFANAVSAQLLTPVVYAQDNIPGASQEGLDYAFSHFCGIFAGSTIYFIIYCAVKKNRPYVSAELVLPSVLYGVLWAFAMTAWFVSNKLLSQAISFPIVTRIPGIVGACWDVFYFKSIKGKKNLTLLAVAVSIAFVGVVLVGLSK